MCRRKLGNLGGQNQNQKKSQIQESIMLALNFSIIQSFKLHRNRRVFDVLLLLLLLPLILRRSVKCAAAVNGGIMCGALAANGNFDRVRDDTKSKKKSLAHIHARTHKQAHGERARVRKVHYQSCNRKNKICTYIFRVFYLLQIVCVSFLCSI